MSSTTPTKPPVMSPSEPLAQYWDKSVAQLCTLADAAISPADEERHRIYCLLLMSLVSNFFNGNKHGQEGTYPWRAKQRRPDGIYGGGQYFGHNIACLGVDGDGNVIDFDFNHNDLFSSSVEHAESRLVRRIFSLTQLYDDRRIRRPNDPPRDTNYLNVLSKVTIYTSLESCAQCSGIMALGKVKAVVYLQPDPGQFCVGNIMYNLTTDALRAPLPVSADKIGLKYFQQLKDGYRDFYDRVTNEPFYTTGAAKDNAQSITSYLCTDEALAIYNEGRDEFASLKPAHPEHKPATDPASHAHALTNERSLAAARTFLDYATALGKRGTPHKL